jgi:tetratricopeptide (TPR) repeat protein
VARHFAAPDRTEEMRAAGLAWIADMRAARGQLGAAWELADSVAALDEAAYLALAGRLATLPFLPDGLREDDRRDVRERLRAFSPDAVRDRHVEFGMVMPAELLGWVRLYLLGLLAARGGDETSAGDMAERLGALERDARDGGVWIGTLALSPLSPGVEVEMERQAGRMGSALARLEEADAMSHLPNMTPFLEMERERFLRAELLAELGRFEEAAAWYDTFVGLGFADLPYRAPAQLRRARAMEELGRRDEAAEAYHRFIQLWEDADEALQPTVREARDRLRALTGPEAGS